MEFCICLGVFIPCTVHAIKLFYLSNGQCDLHLVVFFHVTYFMDSFNKVPENHKELNPSIVKSLCFLPKKIPCVRYVIFVNLKENKKQPRWKTTFLEVVQISFYAVYLFYLLPFYR